MKMALTRDYKDTVVARIKRDPKFARALYAEAVGALLEGETAEGLSMLRDLVRADKAVRAPADGSREASLLAGIQRVGAGPGPNRSRR